MDDPSLPNAIQVGPWRYQVLEDDDAINATCVAAQTDLLGHTDHRHLRITIRPGQAHDMAADTLLHECLHAITTLVGIQHDLDSDDEEAIVTRMAPALLDLLRRNPELVAYLTA